MRRVNLFLLAWSPYSNRLPHPSPKAGERAGPAIAVYNANIFVVMSSDVVNATDRLHASLGYVSPEEFEADWK